MNDKTLTLLGFASKSGNLSFGMDSVKESVKKGKAELVIIAKDISEKSEKEVKFFCEKTKITALRYEYTSDEISHAVGRKCGILAVNDKNFANAIKGGNANV